MIEIRHLRYFVTLGEELHFTRAAKRLRIAQPALSTQLRQLETRLGTRLVDRTNRRVALTEAGIRFYGRAKAILADVDGVEREMADFADAVRGSVTLGSLPLLGELCFPDIISGYERLFPSVEVNLLEERNEQVIEELQDGRIDLALIDTRPLEKVSTSNLTITNLFTAPTVVMMSNDHPLAAQEKVSLSELRHERFVWFSQGSSARYDIFVENCRAVGFEPTIAVKCSQASLLRVLVSNGFGVCISPQWVAALTGPSIVTPELTGYTRRFYIGLAWHNQRYSRAVSSLADHIKEYWSKLPPGLQAAQR